MKKTILLIEDDTSIIDIYKMALEGAGFDVEVVPMGKDALGKIERIEEGKEEKPDLVLLDIILPDMNGMDILREMRKKNNTKDIPVFMLTNYSDDKLEKESSSLKAEKFILKAECSPSKLVKIVKEKLLTL